MNQPLVQLPDEVLDDLIALYRAGEASPATRDLVESQLRSRPELNQRLVSPPLILPALAPDPCIRTLRGVRNMNLWRMGLLGFALITLLVPLHPFFWEEGNRLKRTFIVVAECASCMAWSGFSILSKRIARSMVKR